MPKNGNFALPKDNSILSITCDQGEMIQIGENVYVWWDQSPHGGRRRRIYINAPRDVRIFRPGEWDKRGESV